MSALLKKFEELHEACILESEIIKMMNNLHASKRHDYSTGKLIIRKPTHSTPIKMDGSKSLSFSQSERESTPKCNSSRNKAKITLPASNKSVNSHTGQSSDTQHGSFTVTSASPTNSISQRNSHVETFYDVLNFNDLELCYKILAKLADFENQTIQKQRQELTSMIAELRDRDHELNEMVAAHQKQLAAWEQDRQKLLLVEEKCAKLEREILAKNDELRTIKAKLRVVECEDLDKSAALNNTQEQLLFMSEQQSHASLQIQDLEQRNKSLSGSLKDMSHSLGQLEAREQELLTLLQLKDRDLSDASCHLAELSARLKKMDLQYKEAKSEAAENQRKISEWKNKYLNQQRELDYTKKLLHRSEQRSDEQHLEILRLRQELSTMKKELTLAGEREKRKDQLLDLHKSRQERTDAELTSLRQLYERQQRDLTLLHLNLENTKELLQRHQIDFPGMGSIGFTTGHSPLRSRIYRDGIPSRQNLLSDSYIETSSYIPPDNNDSCDRGNSMDFGKDSDFEVERPSTPPENKRLAAARQTSVLETDSAATKLHKLLTESKVMVEELEKSNQSTPRQVSQQSTPCKNDNEIADKENKTDVDNEEESATGSTSSQ